MHQNTIDTSDPACGHPDLGLRHAAEYRFEVALYVAFGITRETRLKSRQETASCGSALGQHIKVKQGMGVNIGKTQRKEGKAHSWTVSGLGRRAPKWTN